MSSVLRAPATTLRRASPEEAGMSSSRIQQVEELGDRWVKEGVAPAIALLVARQGLVVLNRAFGHLTPDKDSPAIPMDAIFTLASITKLFTATAVMVLVEEGKVGLNRPVSEYVPEFRGEGKQKVLVSHLLTHTSGIGEEKLETYAKENLGKTVIPAPEETLHPLFNEYLALRYECPLWKPPGVEMSYADFNFDLAAEIVRRVSGRPLDLFARDRIFQPLGMNDTHYCRVDAPSERSAQRAPVTGTTPNAWDLAYDRARNTERLYLGSGGALTTAMDMAVFGQMFLNGGAYGSARVLSPVTVAAMTRNQIPGIGAKFLGDVFPEASWGLGWSVHGTKTGLSGGLISPETFEHWGSGGAYVWVDPVNGIVGVYLSTAPAGSSPEIYLNNWKTDLFTDAVTAAIVGP
jgi:serine-type D-Ala-D-Ala carboxypeptidase